MPTELDRTQQRIIGVLIEKELAVPESYPLTEKALHAGCNQKSNRDPEMGLEQFELVGALNALMTDDWVKTATSTGGYATRYAHRLESNYACDDAQKAVLCELLVRGPQAPGALKPRVARLGFNSDPAGIEAILRDLASRPQPLVEQLPKRPRERDCRWRHCLGPMDSSHEAEGGAAPAETVARSLPTIEPIAVIPPTDDLTDRVAKLEAEVAELREELQKLKGE